MKAREARALAYKAAQPEYGLIAEWLERWFRSDREPVRSMPLMEATADMLRTDGYIMIPDRRWIGRWTYIILKEGREIPEIKGPLFTIPLERKIKQLKTQSN